MSQIVASIKRDLSPDERQEFDRGYNRRYRDPGTTFVLAWFSLDRFYLGQVGLGILKLLLVLPTVGIWWLIDLINAKNNAAKANDEIARELERELRAARA